MVPQPLPKRLNFFKMNMQSTKLQVSGVMISAVVHDGAAREPTENQDWNVNEEEVSQMTWKQARKPKNITQ